MLNIKNIYILVRQFLNYINPNLKTIINPKSRFETNDTMYDKNWLFILFYTINENLEYILCSLLTKCN